MPWTEIGHADADALAAALADQLGAQIDVAIAARGSAVLALAGGRTMPPLARRLAARAHDWSAVTIVPTDERWVARDHADCNLRQLQEAFAAAHGIRWVALAPDHPHGPADAAFANANVAALDEAFDACVLGMGADGHFASLFPGAANLRAALDPNLATDALAILPDPMPVAGPHPRVSLGLSRLVHARHVILAIAGADKRAVLDRAQRDNDPMQLPVAALLHATGSTVEIHWSP